MHSATDISNLIKSDSWCIHIRNGDNPYSGTADPLRYWLETPTAIAVRLESDDSLSILAPFGIEDLLAMKIRPTPKGRQKMDQYLDRINTRGWVHL